MSSKNGKFILLFSSDEYVSNTQVVCDSSGVQRRLKLKGDPETECSNRWWQVGNNGGMAATRWLMGLLQECWSLFTIPAVFTWMTHIPVDIYAHITYISHILTARENTRTYFFLLWALVHSGPTVLSLASLVFNGKP